MSIPVMRKNKMKKTTILSVGKDVLVGCKLVQPLWKTVGYWYWLKLSIYPHDIVIPLLGICPQKCVHVYTEGHVQNVPSSIIHNCLNLEITQMFLKGGIRFFWYKPIMGYYAALSEKPITCNENVILSAVMVS